MTPLELSLLLSGAFVAGVVSAIAGFGGGILYLPLVVALVGPREAVPLVTFGLMFSNVTRVTIHWKSIVWPLAVYGRPQATSSWHEPHDERLGRVSWKSP